MDNEVNSNMPSIEEVGSNAPASLSGEGAPSGASDLGEPSTIAPAPASATELPTPEPEALEPPVHVVKPEDDNDSIIPIPLTKQGIEVIATRKGFYGQQRIREGQKFSVSKFQALGEWMTCTDPETEKERKQFFKEKKKAKK